MSLMPFKAAARMSTLSKELHGAWSSLSYLNFGDKFFYYEKNHEDIGHVKFSKIVDQTLANRQKHKVSIQKFWLRLPPCLCCSPYQKWIKILVASNIKDLILSVHSPRGDNFFPIPEEIFAAKELNVLDLCGFKLELPCNGIKFSALRKLKLSHVFLAVQLFRALCATCSCLEELSLCQCRGLVYLQILGSKLKMVQLELVEIKRVVIMAPNLEELRITSIHDKSLDVSGITDCKALKSLYLDGVAFANEKDIFSSLPNLESFYILCLAQ
ncbi:hypothetical protein FXO37_22297 [Capsicum annuum]|nr:hypothetical protein FXO37_22297 [Capsicum annuum]